MAEVRKLNRPLILALVDEMNQMRLDLLNLRAGSVFHASATDAVTTDDAEEDGYGTSSVELVNDLVTAHNAHCASVCSALGVGAHRAADSSNLVTSAVATDLASAITRANELKGDYNTHRASTVFHASADSTNVVSSPNATDEASLVTLLNEIKLRQAGHFAGAFVSEPLEVIDP